MTTISFSAAPIVAVVRRLVTLFAASTAYTPETTASGWTFSPWSSRRISNAALETSQVEAFAQPPPIKPDRKPPKVPKEEPKKRDLQEMYGHSNDILHKLLLNPALYNPLRPPRYPVVLCHGLYGFDVRGPSSFPKLQMHYWNNVLQILRKRVGAEVIVTAVPGTGSITSRAEDLDRALRDKAYGRAVNFMAHSMGGLDCRHLITHLKPTEYTPLSLTTVSTPHRGSPFMDWCTQNIGIGKIARQEAAAASASEGVSTTMTRTPGREPQTAAEAKLESRLTASLAALPSSFATFLLSILDSPAYGNLSTRWCEEVFNPRTPDDPRVRYFSVAGRAPSVNIWHPFWLPKMVVDAWEDKERARLRAADSSSSSSSPAAGASQRPLWARDEEWGNDGLVTVQSARWGEFLGTVEGCDHWEIRGARGIELDIDIPSLQAVSLALPAAVSLRDWDWGGFLGAWRRDGRERVEVDRQKGTIATGAAQAGADEGKSSSEKLSTVFDWIAEHVPTPDAVTRLVSSTSAEEVEAAAQGTNRRGERNELATKEDLERFYVALARKLYDEGL